MTAEGRRDMNGIVVAARYVLGPLRDGACVVQCGGVLEIEDFLVDPAGEKAIFVRDLILGLPNAGRFLRLIANFSGNDPLSMKAVEAYFVGNDLTGKIPLQKRNETVHHNHQVLASRHSLLRFDDVLGAANRCLVKWAKIVRVDDKSVNVCNFPELAWEHGQLILRIKPEIISFKREVDFQPDLCEKAFVTVHRGIVCQTITPAQKNILEQYTFRAIEYENARGER